MKKIFKILTTKNAKLSLVFYLGSFTLNIGNYLFHLLLLRLLAPESYGEFLSYIAFLSILIVPSGTISTAVTKYVSEFHGQKDNKKINHFFYLIIGKILTPAIVLAVLVFSFSNQLAELLKARPEAFMILSISILSSFLTATVHSYLIAFQKFGQHLVFGFIEIITKICVSYLLISNGLGATGGIIGMLFSNLLMLLVIGWSIRKSIYPKEVIYKKLDIKLWSFFTYSFILVAGSLSMFSVDVLLVRYFMDTVTSGIYSALSILGRMIFYGLLPISVLMMPIVTNRFIQKQKTKPILYKLGLALAGFGGVGVIIFSFFPDFVINTLSGSQYILASPLLAKSALTMLLLAISRFLLVYFMSVGHQRASIILLVGMILQPILIFFKHQNISQIVNNNLVIQSSLFLAFLVYYKVALKKIY